MSITGYKIIKLFKIQVDSISQEETYEADLTDEKFTEIASILGCNLQIITSGSKWLLYKGTNTDNGWMCQIASNYFEVRRYLNGVITTGTVVNNNLQCRVQLTQQSNIKTLRLLYSKGKNDTVIFRFTNDIADVLNYCMASATVIDTNDKIYAYGSILSNGAHTFTTSDSTSINYTMTNYYGFADNIILMSTLALKDKSAVFDGLYKCDINKNTVDHYLFDLNGKKYFTSDGSNMSKWAIELDDSMLE